MLGSRETERVSTSTQPLPHRLHRRRAGPVLLLAGVLAIAAALWLVLDRTVFAGETEPARPDLQLILDGLVTGSGRIAPGATAYVAGPRGEWLGAAGVADVESGEAMPADARMRLESVGKIWTATVVLKLAQDGKLRVTDTVERWLPGLFPYGDEITIRQLLTMRSGLVDDNDFGASPAALRGYLARVGDSKLRAQLDAIAQRVTANPATEVAPIWLIRLASWQPLLFEPGTSYHYSNIGYHVLGLIAERAEGRPLASLFDEVIFRPLDLRQSAYDPQGPIAGPHARGYALTAGGKLTDASDRHFGKGADGGIVSNAEETGVFLTALMSGRLLDQERLAGMKGVDLWEGGAVSGCGGRAFGWSGGGGGYKTNVWVSGDGSRVAVLLLNARDLRGAGGDSRAGAALVRLFCAA